jgi:hypothetical protein
MPKTAIPLLFVSALLATASKVDADVVYTVLNPANNFTLFVYDFSDIHHNGHHGRCRATRLCKPP